MGYPAFNLATIQLPAPTSNMTKTEYKAAYGIDLDAVDVRSFKLVIYGNEKYTIDQIKEIEDGIEIYFNGRILSITDIVQTSDEVYDIANSKPIYYHPISVFNNEGIGFLSFAIIDNSPTPYTKTSLIAKIANLSRISPLSGAMLINEKVLIAGYGWQSGDAHYVLGLFADGTSASGILAGNNLEEFINSASTSINDGVNKIN